MKKNIILLGILLLILINTVEINAYGLGAGTYILNNSTYYVNPDTGASDDGGDTSTGEGMCRNATYESSLYEFDGEKHYVTMRIKLISFISDIHFYVQNTKGDAKSYAEISYTVMGENTEENTKDFRFEIPASDVLIKPKFFVGPMNRDVTYFVGLDMDTAEADEGTFAAFNGETEEAVISETPVAKETETNDNIETPETETPETALPDDKKDEEISESSAESENDPDKSDENKIDTGAESKTKNDIKNPDRNEKSEEVVGITGFTAEGDSMEVNMNENENKEDKIEDKEKDEKEDKGINLPVAAGLIVIAGILFIVLRKRK